MWRKSRLDQLPLHLMIVPGLAIVLLFSYGPMAGMAIAFQKLDLTKGLFGSPWVGFDNFTYAFKLPGFQRVLWNT
ncbi:MAG: sugar ABC transporter permease, partial [Paenibacillaceae bacterium]|nr:sugar ABC transporter permease [Paenibacillaceae bacterium]